MLMMHATVFPLNPDAIIMLYILSMHKTVKVQTKVNNIHLMFQMA